jgi:hypothetical protein
LSLNTIGYELQPSKCTSLGIEPLTARFTTLPSPTQDCGIFFNRIKIGRL